MKNVKGKRLFIALNIPAEAKKEIAEFTSLLSNKCMGVKWVVPARLHLTLHFFGNTDFVMEENIKLVMQTMAGKFHLLKFKLGRFSAFPNFKKPRVLYVGLVQTNGNSVSSLQKLLGKKLSHLVKIEKRLWHPHVTLGRIIEPDVFKLPEELPLVPELEFTIDRYDLMQSKLHPEESKFKIVEEFILSP